MQNQSNRSYPTSNLPIDVSKEKNPNWRGGKFKPCLYCGCDYWVYPSEDKSSKYCSRQCQSRAHAGSAPWNKGMVFLAGEKNPMYGKTRSPTTKKLISQKNKGRPSHWKGKKNPQLAEYNRSLEKRLKTSQTLRGKPLTEAHIAAMIRAQHRTPNKSEKVLLGFLNRKFPRQWRFVGDGSVIIGGLNPDFINCNGRKLIIELFGAYWHNLFDMPKRINRFAQYGYNTLVIWEDELEDRDKVIRKVRKFVEHP